METVVFVPISKRGSRMNVPPRSVALSGICQALPSVWAVAPGQSNRARATAATRIVGRIFITGSRLTSHSYTAPSSLARRNCGGPLSLEYSTSQEVFPKRTGKRAGDPSRLRLAPARHSAQAVPTPPCPACPAGHFRLAPGSVMRFAQDQSIQQRPAPLAFCAGCMCRRTSRLSRAMSRFAVAPSPAIYSSIPPVMGRCHPVCLAWLPGHCAALRFARVTNVRKGECCLLGAVVMAQDRRRGIQMAAAGRLCFSCNQPVPLLVSFFVP